MPTTDERRAKLSPEKQMLLARRLQGLAAAKTGDASPAEALAPALDDLATLTSELALDARAPAAVSDELWAELVALGSREAQRLVKEPGLTAIAAKEPSLDR